MKQIEIIASLSRTVSPDLYKEAGCTGVVCCLPFLSAHPRAWIEWEDWHTVLDQCHHLDMKCYVDVNRQFSQSDLKHLQQGLERLKVDAPDGIYYSDPAVWELAQEYPILQDRLLFDCDTVLTSAMDIQQYRNQGLMRCRISQQITLAEVLAILDRVDGDLEYVAVSHLQMSSSKRMLLSCYREEIGADWDTDAIYELEEEHRNERFLICQDEQGTVIRTKDLFVAMAELPMMLQHGLRAIRVDGALMHEQALLDAVYHVRQIVDGANAAAEETAWQKRHPELMLTKGYLYDRTNISK